MNALYQLARNCENDEQLIELLDCHLNLLESIVQYESSLIDYVKKHPVTYSNDYEEDEFIKFQERKSP